MATLDAARGAHGRIVLADSITEIAEADRGCVVVSGSHGGRSSAGYALGVPVALVSFSDAGVGKDEAGIVALALLQAAGVAAVAVAHTSARIGDAHDQWDHGIVSHVNAAACGLGISPGQRLRDALLRLIDGG